MGTYKILNLYAGIGGNRKLWPDTLPDGRKVEITAVELDPKIAAVYKHFFPKDNVIVSDAHQYLLEHFKEFDFIWASPPCQTHSRINYYLNHASGLINPKYQDMGLWQEVLFLKNYFKKSWVVENVKPFYKPLIEPDFNCGRHYFWASKKMPGISVKPDFNRQNTVTENHGFDLSGIKLPNKRRVLRNCVAPEIGYNIRA